MIAFIKDLRRVPVLRLLFPFILGLVLSGVFSPLHWSDVFFMGTWLACLLYIFLNVYIPARGRAWYLVNAACILLLSFSIGFQMYALQTREPKRSLSEDQGIFAGVVKDFPDQKGKNCRLDIKLSYVMQDSTPLPVNENLRLYFTGDSAAPVFVPGEGILFHGIPVRIKNKGNPREFDYAAYMKRRNFRYQVFLRDPGQVVRLGTDNSPLFYPVKIRHRIESHWDLKRQEYALLSAITLGNKSMIEQDTKQAFADAGAMHVLAVSGLHVGMIWFILDKIIRIPKRKRRLQLLKLILVLGILWFYACITGLSDSVTRSVSMFSLFTLAKFLRREAAVFNTLFLSCFILLIRDPGRISEAGFQLSFAAVAGIIALQPRFSQAYAKLHRFLKWLLDLLLVSVSAQLATLPFALYYFEQFPLWFLLSNLLVIPLVSLILVLFVLFAAVLIAFPSFELPSFILSRIVYVLNEAVVFISELPGAAICTGSMPPIQALLLSVLVLSVFLFMVYRKIPFLFSIFIALSLSQGIWIIRTLKIPVSGGIEVYNFNTATLISCYENQARQSYVIEAATAHPASQAPDPFFEKYLESLGRVPSNLKTQHIFRFREAADAPTPAGSSPAMLHPDSLAMFVELASGAWGGRLGGKDILIIGSCESKTVQRILSMKDWEMLLFRKGCILHKSYSREVSHDALVIGDGTLSTARGKYMKKLWPSCYVIKESGAYIGSAPIQKRRLDSRSKEHLLKNQIKNTSY